MYYETVKTPTKCSHNLWVIKMSKKPEITSPCCTLCICNQGGFISEMEWAPLSVYFGTLMTQL